MSRTKLRMAVLSPTWTFRELTSTGKVVPSALRCVVSNRREVPIITWENWSEIPVLDSGDRRSATVIPLRDSGE